MTMIETPATEPKDTNDQLIELLELYMDLAEKQDVVIFYMAGMLRRQASELKNYKELCGFIDMELPADDDTEVLKEAMQDLEQAKSNV